MGFAGTARILALACALALAMPARAAAAPPAVTVQDAWIRWLPAGVPGAGYMTLVNTGATDEVLTGAGSADYASVSLHQTRSDNGMNEMLPVASITLKPHATLRFAEHGYHLMLMQPRRDVHPGDVVRVVLEFGGGRTLEVPFQVRAR